MEAKMHKKLKFLLLTFILCASFLTVQSVSAATQNDTLNKTMLIIDTHWDSAEWNPFDTNTYLYTETYVIEVNSGRHLDHQKLLYELYNPEGIRCEVQNHQTGEAWYNLMGDVYAKAHFCGPFPFHYENHQVKKWYLKVIYNGTDQYAPAEKTIYFYHD